MYGVAFCKLEYSDQLKEMGFAGKSRTSPSLGFPARTQAYITRSTLSQIQRP